MPSLTLKFFKRNYPIVVFALLALSPLFWASLNKVIYGPDTMWSPNGADRIQHLLTSWKQTVSFGYGWVDSGAFLHNLYLHTLMSLGLSYAVTQRLMIGALIFASALFAYLLLREVLEGHSDAKALATAAGLIYALNPFALTWAWWRFLGVMYAYPCWPLIFLVILRIAKDKASYRAIVWYSLAISLFAPGISATVLLLTLGIAVIIFLITYIALARPALPRLISKLGFFVVVCAVINAYWLVPGILMINHQVANALTAESPLAAFQYNSQFTAILNVLKLWGETALHIDFQGQSYYGTGVIQVLGSVAMGAVLLVPFAATLLVLSMARSSKNIPRPVLGAFAILMAVGLFMIKGGNAPFSWINASILHIPLGVAFRIPYDKFAYFVALAYAVITPMVFLVIRSRKARAAMALLLVIYVLVPIIILFTPNAFVPEDKNTLKGIMAQVPREYSQLGKLGLKPSDRILILPTTPHGESSFNWPTGAQTNSHDVISDYVQSDIVYLPNGNSYSDGMTTSIPVDLFSGLYDEATIATTLRALGITHIFIHDDWNKGFMLNKTPWPEYYRPVVKALPGATNISSNKYFELYQLTRPSSDYQDLTIPVRSVQTINNEQSPIQPLSTALGIYGESTSIISDNNTIVFKPDFTSPTSQIIGGQLLYRFSSYPGKMTLLINRQTLSQMSTNPILTVDGKTASFNADGSYLRENPTLVEGAHTLGIGNVATVPVEDSSFKTVALDKQLDWECGTKFADQIKQVQGSNTGKSSLRLESKDNLASCHMLRVDKAAKSGNAMFSVRYRTESGSGSRIVVYKNHTNGIYGNDGQILNLQLPPSKAWTVATFHFSMQAGEEYRPILYSGVTDGEQSVTDYEDMNGIIVPPGFNQLFTVVRNLNANQVTGSNTTIRPVIKSSAIKVVDVSSDKSTTTLALNQSFDPYWHAYIVNSDYKPNLIDHLFGPIGVKPIPESMHHVFNGYGNAWTITPKPGNETTTTRVVVEYLPQRSIAFGVLVTALSMGCIIAFLAGTRIYESMAKH